MPLQRTFSSFPAGWAGAALLVLRVVVGVCVIAEAALAVAGADALLILAATSIAALAGLALVLGFLTPVASLLVAAAGSAVLVSAHTAVLQLLDSCMALFEFVVIAAALAILGPGAASVDARLFGRREVPIGEKRDPHDPVS